MIRTPPRRVRSPSPSSGVGGVGPAAAGSPNPPLPVLVINTATKTVRQRSRSMQNLTMIGSLSTSNVTTTPSVSRRKIAATFSGVRPQHTSTPNPTPASQSNPQVQSQPINPVIQNVPVSQPVQPNPNQALTDAFNNFASQVTSQFQLIRTDIVNIRDDIQHDLSNQTKQLDALAKDSNDRFAKIETRLDRLESVPVSTKPLSLQLNPVTLQKTTAMPSSSSTVNQSTTSSMPSLESKMGSRLCYNWLASAKFSGKKNENAFHFLRDATKVFTMSGAPSSQWLGLIHSAFKDNASRWFENRRSSFTDWSDFSTIFLCEFRQKTPMELLKIALSREQKVGEAFDHYVWDIQDAYEQYNPSTEEDVIFDTVLNNSLPEFRRELRPISKKTIQELLRVGRLVTADLEKAAVIYGTPANALRNRVELNAPAKPAERERLDFTSSPRSRLNEVEKQLVKEQKCFACSETGHKRVDCPKKATINTLMGPYAKECPHACVEINNSRRVALIDSGATYSAMADTELGKFGKAMKDLTPWVKEDMIPAVGPLLPTIGSCPMEIDIQGIRITIDFAVISNFNIPLVLGQDFIKGVGFVTLPNSNSYAFETNLNCRWPLHSFDTSDLVNTKSMPVPDSTIPKRIALKENNRKEEFNREWEQSQAALDALLKDFKGVVSSNTLGHTSLVKHKIDTGNAAPVKCRPYPYSPAKRAEIKRQVDDMLERGIIEPCTSPWASPAVLVGKKVVDQQETPYRLCSDSRGLNEVTLDDAFPMPSIPNILNSLTGAKYFSRIDLRSGYWQIELDEDSRDKSAFVTAEGQYRYTRMSFGLKTAPMTFQRLMNRLLKDCGDFALAYLDDIIIFSATLEGHLKHLKVVLETLQNANLTCNLPKCSFFQTRINFLGFVVSANGIETDPEKVASIRDFPAPQNLTSLRSFLGLVNFYRNYIPRMADIAMPLFRLMKKNVPWRWEKTEAEAFEGLKTKLIESVVLSFPDVNKPFILQTDASQTGMGAVLLQRDNEGEERVVAFASYMLKPAEQRYHATERELLAVVIAVKKFRNYLDCQTFTLRTDNKALIWLNKMRDINSRLVRWALLLQEFSFVVEHIPGKENVVPDAISRAEYPRAEDRIELFEEGEERLFVPNGSKEVATITVLASQQDEQVAMEVLPALTPEILREHQKEDDRLQLFIDFVSQGTLPDIKPLARSIRKQSSQYMLCDSVLYRTENTINEEPTWVPCIPRSLRETVLKLIHDDPKAGHLGVEKTVFRARQRCFWEGMARDCKTYVLSCDICQKAKPTHEKPMGFLQPIAPTAPGEVYSVDLVGPLPPSAKQGSFILVIVDTFSKWIEAYPLRRATTAAVRKLCYEHMCRHGVPRVIISDNGSQFTSRLFADMCQKNGIAHHTTSVYHPQANMVERYNRSLKQILRIYTHDAHRKWDVRLPEAVLALNSAVNSTTGFPPAKLTFGRPLRLPVDNALSQPPSEPLSMQEYVAKIENAMALMEKRVRDNIALSQTRQKRYYDFRHRAVKIQVGDWVVVRSHPQSSKAEGRTAKLALLYLGPYRVVRAAGELAFHLEDEKQKSVGTQHVSNLRLYNRRLPSPETLVVSSPSTTVTSDPPKSDRVLRPNTRKNYAKLA